METERLSDGTLRFFDKRGSASVKRLQPGVLLFTYVGHLHAAYYEPLIRETDAEMARVKQAQQRLVILADCHDFTSVETAFREKWMQWIKENEPHIQIVLGLIKSKLIVMAVSVMSMVTGGRTIKTFSSAHAFEDAITREVPGLHWKRAGGKLGRDADSPHPAR